MRMAPRWLTARSIGQRTRLIVRALLDGTSVAPTSGASMAARGCSRREAPGPRMDKALPSTLETLRVFCIERDDDRFRMLECALEKAGHCVVGRRSNAVDLYEAVQRLQPDMVIVAANVCDEEIITHIGTVNERLPRPVVLFTEDEDPTKIRDAVRCGVTAYVVDGFAPERVEAIVRVALARFERDQRMKSERDEAQAKLAERKLIERAKGILMRKRGVGEDEAYHMLRRMAMDRKLRMSEVAERFLSMSDLLG
jgi:response regulator NasT